jgi:hypothetical protein
VAPCSPAFTCALGSDSGASGEIDVEFRCYRAVRVARFGAWEENHIMKKTLILCASLLALTVGSAWAAGINLGWNDCPGGVTYLQLKTFACTANTGINTLVGTFVAPAGVVECSANEIVIDLQTNGATLAPWWSLRGSAPLGCRSSSMTQSGDFTVAPATCTDYWQGLQSGGVSQDAPVGNRARIKMLEGLPAGNPAITSIPEGTEVYSFKLNINNQKTVGLGSCAGCVDEACIVLNSIAINQPPSSGALTIFVSNPAVSQHAIWQGWSTLDPTQACPLITPAKKETWGSIKALYR